MSEARLRTFAGVMIATAALWNAVPAQAQSDPDALRLAPTRELRAALIASNPVLVARGADGELGGVSVELARALAAKLGVPLRLMAYDNPARYNESLGKGEWDIGLAARDPARGEHLASVTCSWKSTTATSRVPKWRLNQLMKSIAPASRSAWPRVRRQMVS
jgi:ABC-type amino acid transport substrate-binding protein